MPVIHQSSVSLMPPELWLKILGYFVPSGAPTTIAIQPSKPELRPYVLEYRRTLWAACQVSRQVGSSARLLLHQAVLINDCKELLYFFRTLRTVPELRDLVRSFYWTGTLPQSDGDDVECIDLMPSLVAVFASLPPPVTQEDHLLHQFLHAENLAAFRFWRLLGVVLAIIPKIDTLFLVLGRFMPRPNVAQHHIDRELVGGGTPEERARLLSLRQTAYELLAIRVLTMDPIFPASIGYSLLPELRVFILDHISNVPPSFPAFDGGASICDLSHLCPQLQYIQTKSSLPGALGFEPWARSASMRSLLVRKQRFPASALSRAQAAYPNLASLRILVLDGYEHHPLTDLFKDLIKFRHLQYLSITTPHDLMWQDFHLLPAMNTAMHPTMPPFLRRMESLQHLRVDFIWLTTRSDPSPLLHLASLLPQSIKSLHLIDYWGVDMTSTHLHKHPEFPDDVPAREFMYLVLENLLQSCTLMGLTSLREVKLSSVEYAEGSGRSAAARVLADSFVWKFWQVGIRLTMTGLQETKDEEEGWWLNLD